jgi:SAM-dependent methyltransferase
LLGGLLFTLATAACTPVATTAPEPSTGEAEVGPGVVVASPDRGDSAAESVRPGVNDGYREPGSLQTWVDRFEHPDRDVIEFRDQIVARLRLAPGQVVADVGAGTGAFEAPLSAAVGSEGRVFATDITPAFLERLREHAETLKNVEVIEGRPRDAMLPAGAVDLVLMVDVYHHVEYPAALLETIHEALTPDGALVVVDFERIEGETSQPMLKHIRASRQTVQSEVEAAGFTLDETLDFMDENYFMRFRRTTSAR